MGSFFGEERKENRLPSFSSPPACACVCAREYERARAEAFLRLRCLETEGAIGEGSESGRGLPDPRRSRARASEWSLEPRLPARAKAERGGRWGRPPGLGGPPRRSWGEGRSCMEFLGRATPAGPRPLGSGEQRGSRAHGLSPRAGALHDQREREG